MHPEPIRHHYIPQFILRNFCDENNQLHYFDSQTKSISLKDTRDVFMERHLYRDDIHYASEPAKIEKDLAEYEREIAPIIKKFLLNEKDILLTVEEEAKLKLFFAIMGFRSLNAKGCFAKDWKMLPENPVDFWKHNLGYVVNCRSIEEVLDHPDIHNAVKVIFCRDTFGYIGKHLAFVEANDEDFFVISDVYPISTDGILPNGLPVHLYNVFPLSPKRALFVVDNGAQYAPRRILELREFLFQPPNLKEKSNVLRFRVRKLSTDEVRYINGEIIKHARQGVAFRSESIQLMLPQCK